MLREFLKGGAERKPAGDDPVVADDPGTATGELAITWYGHASSLVEIDGSRVLFDPDLERPLLAVPTGRTAPAAPGADRRSTTCRASTRS